MIANLMVLLAKALTGVSVRWQGCQPDFRQRIYYANHSSHLDALVLWSVLPAGLRACTRPVAARDYWVQSAHRRYLAERVFRAILIERAKPTAQQHPVKQILEAMGTTGSIILFPEGGRHAGQEPQPFKSGLYHLAQKRPDVELVPVSVLHLDRILPKGEVLPIPLMGRITFGAPIQVQPGETKSVFLERARQRLIELRNG